MYQEYHSRGVYWQKPLLKKQVLDKYWNTCSYETDLVFTVVNIPTKISAFEWGSLALDMHHWETLIQYTTSVHIYNIRDRAWTGNSRLIAQPTSSDSFSGIGTTQADEEHLFFFYSACFWNAFPCLWGHLCHPAVPTPPSGTFSGSCFRLWAPFVLLCHFMTQLRGRKSVKPGTPAAERAQELGESRAPSHEPRW